MICIYINIYTYIIRSYTVTHPQSGLFHCSIHDDLDVCHSNGFFWILFINSWNSNEKNPEIPPRGACPDVKLRSVWRGFLSKLVEKPYSHHVRYHYIAKPHVLRLFGGKSLQRIGFATFPTFILAWYGQFPSNPSIWRPPTIWSNLKSSST